MRRVSEAQDPHRGSPFIARCLRFRAGLPFVSRMISLDVEATAFS